MPTQTFEPQVIARNERITDIEVLFETVRSRLMEMFTTFSFVDGKDVQRPTIQEVPNSESYTLLNQENLPAVVSAETAFAYLPGGMFEDVEPTGLEAYAKTIASTIVEALGNDFDAEEFTNAYNAIAGALYISESGIPTLVTPDVALAA